MSVETLNWLIFYSQSRWVSGRRRSGGPFLGEVAQGRDAEEIWLRHPAEDAKGGDKGRGGLASDECRNDILIVDRVARYLFDYCSIAPDFY